MEKEILELAFTTLQGKFKDLANEVRQLKEELKELKDRKVQAVTAAPKSNTLDELLTIKQVQKILGVCYNTLQNSIVKKGLLIPKKISERKIRFSKRELLAYMDSLPINIKGGNDE